MIICTDQIALPQPTATIILEYFRRNTVLKYKPLGFGDAYLQVLFIKGLSDYKLVEGYAVPAHDDGIDGYRALLMLDNPGQNYTIKGNPEIGLVPRQGPGDIVVLDISQPHQVKSRDPNGSHGPWSALAWEPGGEPCMKKDWTADDVSGAAAAAFTTACNLIKEHCNASQTGKVCG